VKWQSRRLPRGAAGVTQLRKGRGAVQVTGIAVADLNMPQGNLTEILTHELGHALGLDHSEDPRDIMYRSTHNRTLPSGTLVQLTQRDLRMLQWLYTHSRAVPIVAAR
jgi:predicted Zn-dependent protease